MGSKEGTALHYNVIHSSGAHHGYRTNKRYQADVVLGSNLTDDDVFHKDKVTSRLTNALVSPQTLIHSYCYRHR